MILPFSYSHQGSARVRVAPAERRRRAGVVVIASACVRAQRTGGFSSTERQHAGTVARLIRHNAKGCRQQSGDGPPD
jgi:hypothetical protein